MDILEVKGNTYCIDTGMTYIPFYKINDEEIIMLDTGWEKGERSGIEEVLEINNFKVKAIINSHGHICIITPDDVAYIGDALISYEVIKRAKMPYAYIQEK